MLASHAEAVTNVDPSEKSPVLYSQVVELAGATIRVFVLRDGHEFYAVWHCTHCLCAKTGPTFCTIGAALFDVGPAIADHRASCLPNQLLARATTGATAAK